MNEKTNEKYQQGIRGVVKIDITEPAETLKTPAKYPHLTDRIAQNRHVPGIFILNLDMSIGETIDELIVIAECAFEDEYQDQIVYLPIPQIS